MADVLVLLGFDVPDISLVVNFDMPYFNEKKTKQDALDEVAANYQHRIGRTGRIGKAGVAFSFVTTREMHLIEYIKSHWKIERPMLELQPDDYLDKIEEEVEAIQDQLDDEEVELD